MPNRPDHSSGFIQEGYGWMAAVVAAPLTHLERKVWLEVTFQWLGFARRPVVILSPTQIARRVRTSRGNVGTAIQGLLSKRMLVKLSGGYEPEGDPAVWQFGESSQERANRLAYIAETFQHVRDIRPLDPKPVRPAPEPATQQLSFLDDPADLEPSPATPDRGEDCSTVAEHIVLSYQNTRSAVAEQKSWPHRGTGA